jgi:hypothetical protein
MAEEGGDAGEVRDDAPNPMVLMGDILDKLKILGYEDFARKNLEGRLLHGAYFVVPHPKPNEQFNYFTQIFTYLMRMNKFSFEAPGEFDDPNTTVANMMEVLADPEKRDPFLRLCLSSASLRALTNAHCPPHAGSAACSHLYRLLTGGVLLRLRRESRDSECAIRLAS